MGTERLQLLFPPPWITDSPYPAPAVLIGWLKGLGIETSFADLNILLFHSLLDESFLKSVGYDKPRCRDVSRVLEYRQFMSSDAFYDFQTYQEFQDALNRYHAYLTSVDGRNAFLPGMYIQRMFGNPPTAQGVVNSGTVLDRELYRLLDRHCDRESGLFGITIASSLQLPFAMKIAAWLRRNVAHAQICAGGPFVTAGCCNLLRVDGIGSLFDFLIVGEGEEALASLMSGDIGHPNIYKLARPGEPRRDRVPVSTFVQPVYDLHDLDAYPLPERLLTTNFDRGCYWGRCKFCNYNAVFDKYSLQAVPEFVDQLEGLSRQYRTRHFHLAGSALPAVYGAKVADRLSANSSKISWFVSMRCENPTETRKALPVMASAGCLLIAWGLESAAQQVLDEMDKGIHADHFDGILEASHAYGICNTCMFIRGYPGETDSQFEKTLAFILNHRRIIDIAIVNEFQYGFGSDVYRRNCHRPGFSHDPLLQLMTVEPPSSARNNLKQIEDEYVEAWFLPVFGQIIRNDVSLALCKDEVTPANFFHYFMYSSRKQSKVEGSVKHGKR